MVTAPIISSVNYPEEVSWRKKNSELNCTVTMAKLAKNERAATLVHFNLLCTKVDLLIWNLERCNSTEDPGADFSQIEALVTRQSQLLSRLADIDDTDISLLVKLLNRLLEARPEEEETIVDKFNGVLEKWRLLNDRCMARMEELIEIVSN